jgi:transposase-like protein/DNA-binding CsgD family transcriptional regulator
MIPQEKREEIARDYVKSRNSINMLAAEHGVSRGTVINILNQLNVERRHGSDACKSYKIIWRAMAAEPDLNPRHVEFREKNRKQNKKHSPARKAHYKNLQLPEEELENTVELYQEMSTQEVAAELGISPEAVRARLRVAGAKLRDHRDAARLAHRSKIRKPRKKRAPEPEVSWETALEARRAEAETAADIASKTIDMATLMCPPGFQPPRDSNGNFVQATHFEAALFKDHRAGDPNRRYPDSFNHKEIFKIILRSPHPLTVANIGSCLDDLPGDHKFTTAGTRRCLKQLLAAQLIAMTVVPNPGDPPGRPPNRYTITDKGKDLAVKVGYKKSDSE